MIDRRIPYRSLAEAVQRVYEQNDDYDDHPNNRYDDPLERDPTIPNDLRFKGVIEEIGKNEIYAKITHKRDRTEVPVEKYAIILKNTFFKRNPYAFDKDTTKDLRVGVEIYFNIADSTPGYLDSPIISEFELVR